MALDELLELDKKKLRKSPSHAEDDLQKECVRIFRYKYQKSADALIHIPNEGKRKTKLITRNGIARVICTEGAKLKQMGLKAGAPDLILFEKKGQYGALFIELKSKKGSQSENQKKWQKTVEEKGYKYIVCNNIDSFLKEVDEYMNL